MEKKIPLQDAMDLSKGLRKRESYEDECKALIGKHAAQTGSNFSKNLLLEWELERGKFWQVIPKEMLTRLSVPLESEAAE